MAQILSQILDRISPGRSDLSAFRKIVRRAFEEIKKSHGHEKSLNVFPAMPVSAAIEFGRVWQPKADMELIIFDENRNKGGFTKALTIQNKEFL